jgi:hypothetical protein
VQQRDAIVEPVFADIARRHCERVRRNVDGIDGGIGKPHRCEDGERARSGAEIEHAGDLVGIPPSGIRSNVLTGKPISSNSAGH